jgi:hypothetical protein
MSESLKPVAVLTRESPAEPALLSQIVEMMERRERIAENRPRPIEIKSFDELERWANIAARSEMVPKAYIGKPEMIIIAVDFGAELGLKRMQSLQSIAVINGKPGIYGDALWALIISQPTLEDAREWFEGEGDNLKAICEIKRRGRSLVREEFTVAQAKTAKLWGKKGYNGQDTPWITNPDRMLKWRARTFAARDTYADVLKGMQSAEELQDIADYDSAPARDTEPRAPVTMPKTETKPTPSGPTQKTIDTVDGMINKICSCEAQEEWLEYDTKSQNYREKLTRNHPELSNKLEGAFEDARKRLFPEPEGDENPFTDELTAQQ